MPQKTFNGYFLGFQTNGNSLDDLPPYFNKVTFFKAGVAPDSTLRTVYLESGYGKPHLIKWIRDLQARGIEVLLSLLDSPDVQWDQIDIPTFAKSVKEVAIDGEWGFNGIDGTRDISGKIISRLSVVGYIPSLEAPVLSVVGKQLDWINTMLYFGSAQDNKNLYKSYLAYNSQINLGIGSSYEKGQSTDLSTVSETTKFATLNPGCGMMQYSINGDNQALTGRPNWTWAKTVYENLYGTEEIYVEVVIEGHRFVVV